MSYKVKPQLKLYKFENNSFVLQAIIDDYSEVSFEHNLYQAGTFTISINYNIPNSQLFQRGLFVQFGNNPGDFGEIYSIQDSISKDGKGSQTRTIVGYDARYILKRRVIKNMNSNGLWVMTAKGELCIRNLIKDQCGVDAEEKRRLPIINNIPDVSEAKGKEYSVSEQFTNLYEVCKTIATQSEIGWRISFINNELNLEIYEGEDLSQTVRFDTNYESLANGKFSDTSESFSNAIYIGGKGQNDSRDIYEGENGSPSGFNRFESWDNQSQMTTEDEYETEAISMLSQYGQTLTITGNGLVKCPYVFREQYDVGDIITVAFSGKSAAAQILSVTEHWSFGNYEINFNFGKPQNNLSDQLQLMLRQIQKASETSNSTESVKWYNVANENTMDSADVTYNTIGFTGAMTSNKTFTFYLDDEKTGAKSYNIYAKNLTGNYNLTLTTGRSGKTNVVLKGGVNITSRILIDEEGNIICQEMNFSPAQSAAVNSGITSGLVNKLNNINVDYDLSIGLGDRDLNTESLVQLIIDGVGGSYYPWGIVNSITVYLGNHTFTSSNGVRVTANILKLTSVGDTYNSDYPAETWAAMIGTMTAITSAGKVTRYAAEFNWGDAIDTEDPSVATIILSKLVTTIPGVNDHVQYYIPATLYAIRATTSGSTIDYYFGTYGASSLVNLVNPGGIYTDVRLEDGKFTFKCYLQSGAYSNSVGTKLFGVIAVGRKFFVDALNIMLDKSFTYSQFSSWANANNYKIDIGYGKIKFAGEPGVEDLIAQSKYNTEDVTLSFGSYTTGGITHYNGVNLYYQAFVILRVSSGTHTSGNDTGAGEMYCTVDLSGFIAQYS